jgi:hypothetical protein
MTPFDAEEYGALLLQEMGTRPEADVDHEG